MWCVKAIIVELQICEKRWNNITWIILSRSDSVDFINVFAWILLYGGKNYSNNELIFEQKNDHYTHEK